ncbi:MAG: hypothetical protein K5705_16545 [Oscillospiraceae bacterium]|nr:hypothetical protein [Oscillospiraceae bacterium]
MKAFSEIYQTIPGILLLLAAVLLVLGQFGNVLRAVQKPRQLHQILLAALHLAAGFTLLFLLLYGIDEEDHSLFAPAPERQDFSRVLMAVPAVIYAGAECISAGLLYLQSRIIRRYRIRHLTPDAVKEALDHLPVAVCISDLQGNVFLSNLRMNELTEELTTEHLLDAHSLWLRITELGTPWKDGYLLHGDAGRVYLFTKKPMTVQETGTQRPFTCITASDMTEVYRITEDLAAKNKHLKEVQFHMRAVAAYERSLIAARESIKARTAVHNQLGSVLLCGKHYLDHPERVKADELLHLLNYSSFFQLVEAEQKKTEDAVYQAIRFAKRIGVTVKITDAIPEHPRFRDLLAQAIEQCAANTVRHAGGDCLSVTLHETDTHCTAQFRNNGNPPVQPVTETGGLLYLRQAAETDGGTMTIMSEPVFLLTVSLPKTENS